MVVFVVLAGAICIGAVGTAAAAARKLRQQLDAQQGIAELHDGPKGNMAPHIAPRKQVAPQQLALAFVDDRDVPKNLRPAPRPSLGEVRRRATRVLCLTELVVPRRLATEEIGDAIELIAEMVRKRRPPWQIYLKVVSTIFWILVHAAHEVIRGPAKKSTGKNDG